MPLFPAPTSAAFLVLVVPCGSNRSGFFQLGEDVSISRRTSTMVRTLGVASAAAALTLGVAGSAFACNIGDFTPTVSCNSTDYTATVKVHDTDGSYATLTLQKNGQDVSPTQTVHISGGGDRSDTATFTGIPWNDVSSYDVHVVVDGQLDSTLNFPAGTGDCAAPTQSPTPTPSPSQTTDSPKPTPTPTDTATTAAPTTAAPTDTSTVDATATASPTGAVLATTGGGSDSGMIAGIAGAFVVVGAGAVFFLRRRSAGSHS